MYKKYRDDFNRKFSQEKYVRFLDRLFKDFDYKIPFRIAETPVFFESKYKNLFLSAASDILDQILTIDLEEITRNKIPERYQLPGDDGKPHFIAIDFGLTQDEDGNIVPKLIELQGFPSLFCYQPWLYNHYKDFFELPDNLTPYFLGDSEKEYFEILRKIIVGDCDPQQVILLEIEPEKQNTAIDFFVTKKIFGIDYVCLTKVYGKGNKLYYNKDGKAIQIKRIYNRVIFDELDQRRDLNLSIDFNKTYDVKWITHPNWFFKISKLLLPEIKSKYSPECIKLNEEQNIPDNLENYVLKPLFSFSGSGVVFNVKEEDILQIPKAERSNYILQEKVPYARLIEDPDDVQKSKAELRILYVWPEDQQQPIPMINLMRLSKGEMIGVKYNKNKTWVGGSIGLFEK
ncbi:hypothetical protein [Schleiferia thermophila]|uniref:Circularly permuted ATP-grasp superfamily protein n=1 Tax=Schleiferia thermophila TaxID=884107 RepID=A0A369ADZ7_9FLAO|nr:hypothetical protein [Schleiferia thermophila]RCX05654.1 hypothetical protein DES35_101942 [Schleiferia thermophila]GCD78856.1 hypothetical protein JCM30197_01030 [Schleiferia thermophila]